MAHLDVGPPEVAAFPRASAALSRFTVLDLTRVRSGPTAVRQLADWGARVIKIESPEGLDSGEPPGGPRDGPGFQNLHRNKRSLALNHSSVDLWILLAMGALGYGLRKLAFDPAPLVLGLVISPTLELSLRQSLILSNGDARIFVERPIAAALFSACALPLVLSARRLLGQNDWRGRLARLQGGEP